MRVEDFSTELIKGLADYEAKLDKELTSLSVIIIC